MRPEEELLVRYARTAEAAAAEELARQCGPELYRTALGVLGDAHEAEDAAQEAVLGLLRGARTYRPGGSLRAWLGRLAVNAARDRMRARARHARVEKEGAMQRERVGEEREELADAVRAAVARLAEPRRSAVVLVYFQGLSRQEAAGALGVPVGTVSSTLARAKEDLRARLAGLGALAVGLSAGGLDKALAAMPPAAVPAQVAARLVQAARSGLARRRAAHTTATGKGGIAMKIIAGVIAAGALAGAIAVSTGRGGGTPATTGVPAGPPKYEHFAFCCVDGHLDGPRAEALAPVGKAADVDAKGNFFFIPGTGGGVLRCARADGMVETIAGADRWMGALPLEEGPAAFIPHLQRAGGIGNPTSTVAVMGDPLKSGEDGYIVTRGGHGTGFENCIYKVWKNKEKEDRWWFRTIAGNGKAAPPMQAGQSAPARDSRFPRLPFIYVLEVKGKSDLYMHSSGNLWRYDDGKGTLTCVLSTQDYVGKPEVGLDKNGKPIGGAETIAITPDGSFYLNWYNTTYPKGVTVKISADRKKVGRVAECAGSVNRMWDGPGMRTAYFGGPLLVGGSTWAPDVVFFGAIDDALLRRFKDGRVSTLCKDGEWREFPNKGVASAGEQNYFQCPPGKGPNWGRGWTMGEKGYFYQTYNMGGGDAQVWRIGPIDFGKPTVGPLVGGK